MAMFRPRERRSQLVRDVLEQPPFCGEQRLETLGHVVERVAEVTDFVLARHAHTHAQIPAAELADGARHVPHRPHDTDRQEPGETHDGARE